MLRRHTTLELTLVTLQAAYETHEQCVEGLHGTKSQVEIEFHRQSARRLKGLWTDLTTLMEGEPLVEYPDGTFPTDRRTHFKGVQVVKCDRCPAVGEFEIDEVASEFMPDVGAFLFNTPYPEQWAVTPGQFLCPECKAKAETSGEEVYTYEE